MKKHFKILVILFLGIFLMAGSAMAIPLMTSSTAVMMIDGVGDNDIMVNVGTVDTSTDIDFGFINTGGDFVAIVSGFQYYGSHSFKGGAIVDFAIRDSMGGNITRASEGTAEMFLSGDVLATSSAQPTVLKNYWQNLTITWASGNNDMVVNLSGVDDGFAPAPAPAPEPATMFLLGSGLLGLAGMGRKRFFER